MKLYHDLEVDWIYTEDYFRSIYITEYSPAEQAEYSYEEFMRDVFRFHGDSLEVITIDAEPITA